MCGSVKPVGPSNVLSMAQLRTLPLVDQVRTLMKNGRLPHNRVVRVHRKGFLRFIQANKQEKEVMK